MCTSWSLAEVQWYTYGGGDLHVECPTLLMDWTVDHSVTAKMRISGSILNFRFIPLIWISCYGVIGLHYIIVTSLSSKTFMEGLAEDPSLVTQRFQIWCVRFHTCKWLNPVKTKDSSNSAIYVPHSDPVTVLGQVQNEKGVGLVVMTKMGVVFTPCRKLRTECPAANATLKLCITGML